MIQVSRKIRGLLPTAFAAAILLPSMAVGQEDDEHDDEHVFTVGEITVEHPWARAAVAGSDTLAFAEFINAGPDDRIVSMTTDVAASVTLVGLTNMNGVIEMVPVGEFDLPGGEFEFDPGGLGFSLSGLTQDLVEGAEFEMTVTFSDAGELTFHVLVEAADAMAHSHNH